MSLMTSWGYTLTEVSSLTDIMTVEEFDAFTASRYTGDARVESAIKAASAAIRSYCGWHIYPTLACHWRGYLGVSQSITRRGLELLIQLPARFISEVTSVTIAGVEIDPSRYVWEPHGLLRVRYACSGVSYDIVEVLYMAGIQEELMDGIKELAANRATHALASSYGITSESTGGVSVTYSAAWTGSTRASALTDDSKELLQPYRLQGVF